MNVWRIGKLKIHRRLTHGKEIHMSIARVTEISASSTKSFDDAIQQGIDRASKTLRNVKSAWIKDQQVEVENGKAAIYRVLLKVTFILED